MPGPKVRTRPRGLATTLWGVSPFQPPTPRCRDCPLSALVLPPPQPPGALPAALVLLFTTTSAGAEAASWQGHPFPCHFSSQKPYQGNRSGKREGHLLAPPLSDTRRSLVPRGWGEKGRPPGPLGLGLQPCPTSGSSALASQAPPRRPTRAALLSLLPRGASSPL